MNQKIMSDMQLYRLIEDYRLKDDKSEATGMSGLLNPMLDLLGYNIFDANEVQETTEIESSHIVLKVSLPGEEKSLLAIFRNTSDHLLNPAYFKNLIFYRDSYCIMTNGKTLFLYGDGHSIKSLVYRCDLTDLTEEDVLAIESFQRNVLFPNSETEVHLLDTDSSQTTIQKFNSEYDEEPASELGVDDVVEVAEVVEVGFSLIELILGLFAG